VHKEQPFEINGPDSLGHLITDCRQREREEIGRRHNCEIFEVILRREDEEVERPRIGMSEENVVECGGGCNDIFECDAISFQRNNGLDECIERRRILCARHVVHGMQDDVEDRGTLRYSEHRPWPEVISVSLCNYRQHGVEPILRRTQKDIRMDVKIHRVARNEDKI
jgi:hypothetical protein